MVASGEQNIGAELMHLEIVWQNPLTLVQAQLRAKWQAIPTTDGQNKPEKFAHVEPIGTPATAGRHEQS